MSKLTAKELIEVMESAKKLGVSKFKGGGIDVSFVQEAQPTKEPDPIKDESIEDVVAPLSILDDYSEEEIKYFATPYFDELQAKKQAREEQLKTEGKQNG